MNFIRPKIIRSAIGRCPIKEIVAKVTKLKTMKIEFRHLRLLLLSSARLAPLLYASGSETRTLRNSREIILAGAF